MPAPSVAISQGSLGGGNTHPYTATTTISCVVGDVIFAIGYAYEWNDASPGSRDMDMSSSGWTQVLEEEFQIFPTAAPLRRNLWGVWRKVATSTSESATATLSGATGSPNLYFYLRLLAMTPVDGRIGTYRRAGATTRHENTALGTGPPWVAPLPTVGAGEVGILLVLGNDGNPASEPGAPFVTLINDQMGTAQNFRNYRFSGTYGTSPSSVTIADINSTSLAKGLVWGLSPLGGWHLGSVRFDSSPGF